MTEFEKIISQHLTSELVNRAQADEKIAELRAALSAARSVRKELQPSLDRLAELEAKPKRRRRKRDHADS